MKTSTLLIILLLAAGTLGARSYPHRDVIVHGAPAANETYELAKVTRRTVPGAKHVVLGRMEIRQATGRMLASLELHCGDGQVLSSTQNTVPGASKIVLSGRLLATASGDTLTCVMKVRGGVHGQTTDTYRVAASGTWLDIGGRQPGWTRGRFPTSDVLRRPGGSVDAAPLSVTVPASRFNAVADVEYTNCYSSYSLCTSNPSNSGSTTIRTRLIVQQKAEGGGYCKATRFPAKTTTITRTVHHLKIHHRGTVTASNASGCTDRYRVKVYTRVLSGNDAVVHSAPYTYTFVRS